MGAFEKQGDGNVQHERAWRSFIITSDGSVGAYTCTDGMKIDVLQIYQKTLVHARAGRRDTSQKSESGIFGTHFQKMQNSQIP